MMKPKPGTPCMHLLALLMRKFAPSSHTSSGTPPKLLMASTISRLPYIFTTWATSRSGFRMPVVVSQCTMATCVISGLCAR